MIGSIAALAATEEKLHQQFPVQPGGTVVVEVDFGSINVSTNATSEVVVDVGARSAGRRRPTRRPSCAIMPSSSPQDGNT